MRRARRFAPILAVALAVASVSDAAKQTVDQVNGIGLIDYGAKPVIEVGSWVKYHMTGSSEGGETDDYTVTLLIAGEERFWGEDCFWVETWTEHRGQGPREIATLMSHDIFKDDMPNLRSKYYMRKNLDNSGPDGSVGEQLVRRPGSTLKKRDAYLDLPSVKLDTMGTDTVSVLGRTLTCRKVQWFEGKAATIEQRDSAITTELRETRMTYISPEIPVTRLAREQLERSIRRKTWAIGRSQEGSSWFTMDRATGSATLIGYGKDGKSRLLPEARQVSLRQIDAASSKPRPVTRKPAAPKPATRSGG